MGTEQMIPVTDLCTFHHIDANFVQSLHTSGLIEITTISEINYVHSDQLHLLEQYIRLHYDLEINLAGIEAITYLLEKMEAMQDEIRTLRNKLDMYEIQI
jgi:chaperone modulatory protein CbpM